MEFKGMVESPWESQDMVVVVDKMLKILKVSKKLGLEFYKQFKVEKVPYLKIFKKYKYDFDGWHSVIEVALGIAHKEGLLSNLYEKVYSVRKWDDEWWEMYHMSNVGGKMYLTPSQVYAYKVARRLVVAWEEEIGSISLKESDEKED